MTLSRARLHVGLQSGLRNENSLLQTPAPGALPRESHYARCVFPREESSWDSRSAWKCCRAAFPSVRARWSVQATHPSLAVGAFKTRCLSFALKHILSGRIWSVTVTPTLLHHPIQVTGRLDLGTNWVILMIVGAWISSMVAKNELMGRGRWGRERLEGNYRYLTISRFNRTILLRRYCTLQKWWCDLHLERSREAFPTFESHAQKPAVCMSARETTSTATTARTWGG